MSVKCSNILRRNISKYYFVSASVHRTNRIHYLPQCLSRESPFLNALDYRRSTPNIYPLNRAMSSGDVKNIEISDYLEMREDPKTTIIDVREIPEITETGILPGAINIPLGDVPAALQKDSASFEKMYNKSKPAEGDRIIFSCRSGKRSMMAAQTAQKLGYENSLNLAGGWLAWEEYIKSKK